jgi:hypothetical protein
MGSTASSAHISTSSEHVDAYGREWTKRYGKPYSPDDGERRVFGEFADKYAIHVASCVYAEYLADAARWLTENKHPIRALRKQWDIYFQRASASISAAERNLAFKRNSDETWAKIQRWKAELERERSTKSNRA